MAIRQGECLIQNAEDFYAWSKKTEESGSKIKYIFYNQEEVMIYSNRKRSQRQYLVHLSYMLSFQQTRSQSLQERPHFIAMIV